MQYLIQIFYERTKEFIQGYSPLFYRGFLVALYPSWIFLFGKSVIPANVFFDFILKGVGVGIMGIISAFCTVLATDFYKHKIKNRIFKTNKNDTQKEEDNERAA